MSRVPTPPWLISTRSSKIASYRQQDDHLHVARGPVVRMVVATTARSARASNGPDDDIPF
jgi:hypothetical protein